MENPNSPQKIKEALLDYAQTIDSAVLFPALTPEAASFVVSDPYAFAIATCLDRGAKADVIWTIPYYIREYLGHLDPSRIYKMSIDDLTIMFERLPRKPRFVNDAPRTLSELTQIVVEEYDGDVTKIWTGKSAREVKRTFQSIHGVGNGIANMAVLLIEKAFPIRFNDLDRVRMDIKPDVHTMRVLYRLGVSDNLSEQEAIDAARFLSPEFPGAVDGALWYIGRSWCYATTPKCSACPVEFVCIKQIN